MANINSSYSLGGATTQTSAPMAGPPGGNMMDPELAGLAKDVIKQRLQRAKDATLPQAPRMNGFSLGAGSAPHTSGMGGLGSQAPGGSIDNIRQQAQVDALHRAQGQTNSMSRRAPTRTVTGPNIIPGETMDPNAMSGFDRDVFLPQQSVMSPQRQQY